LWQSRYKARLGQEQDAFADRIEDLDQRLAASFKN
jgi:hypothetical protein